MRQRRNKKPGSRGDRAGESASRLRRRPPLPAYETVMGIGVQAAVGGALAELAERVVRVTSAAAELQAAIARGETLSQDATGNIAAGLLDAWASRLAVLVEEGKPGWHPQTEAWWVEAWHSPMSAEWLAVDRHALNRLAVLVEMFWREPTQQLLAEIRLQEQRFGLTWADRHRLGWKAPAKPDATAQPQTAKEMRDEGKDPREGLRAVP